MLFRGFSFLLVSKRLPLGISGGESWLLTAESAQDIFYCLAHMLAV
jgi:hypothetical protein